METKRSIFSAGQKIFLLFVTFVILLALRRPLQILHPAVWNEDATFLVPSFIEKGLNSWLDPVAGYLVTSARITSALSLKISFAYYPEISTLLSLLLSASVCLAVVIAPTMIKYPLVCALALTVLPIEPEVYVIPLYTIWWMNVLLILSLLWKPQAQSMKSLSARASFIVLGSLSTPLSPIFALFQFGRAFFVRRKGEIGLAVLSVFLGGAQYYFLSISNSTSNSFLEKIVAEDFKLVLTRYVVEYFWGPIWEVTWHWVVALIALCFILVIAVRNISRKDNTIGILVLVYIAILALTIARAPSDSVHHIHGAPRYFFLPFLLMTWILLQLMDWKKSKSLSLIITIGFILAAIKILPFWSRPQDRLDWRQDVSNCLSWDRYVMGAQYTGSARALWPLPLRQEDCHKAVNNSLFDTSLNELWLKPATEFNIFVAVEMPTVGGPFCPECSFQFQKAPEVQSYGFLEGATPPEFSKPNLHVYGTYAADFQTKRQLVLTYPASSQYLEFAFLSSAPDTQLYAFLETVESGEFIARYTLPFLSGWHFLRFKIPETFRQRRLRVTIVDEGPAWVSVAIPKDLSDSLRTLPKDLERKIDL